ncbi:MAG: prepilin peptidase [Lentisphaeria bacterium]|nr:prepilin peptidase [Lentisphaeria bacterium]
MLTVAAIGFIMGAVIGSFLNVVVWRIPRGMSLCRPPSTCPKCGHRILPWENIPILSWICLRGRCSKCHLPISWKYPAGEAAVGLLYALISVRVWQEGLPLETLLPWWWFAGTMLSLARIDAEHGIIPNRVTYSGMVAAAILSIAFPLSRPAMVAPQNPNYGGLLTGKILDAIKNTALPETISLRLASLADCICGLLAGFIILGTVYYLGEKAMAKWRKSRPAAKDVPEEPLGKGDIKMLAMTGAFIGADAVVFTLCGGCILAFMAALVIAAKNTKKASPAFTQVPFAPFFAVPSIIWVTSGNWLYFLYKICENS